MTPHRSTFRIRSLACALLVVGGASVAPRAQAQGTDAALTDEARKLYDEGKKARDKGDHPACVAKLRAAWALKKHRQVAGLLGECELRTGAMLEATEHLSYFLDNADEVPEAIRAEVRKLYHEARVEVAVVTVKASVEGADRRVDGRPLGPDEKRAFLTPGEHVFSASKAGAGAGEKRVFVSGGQEREVVIDLVADAAPPVAPPPVVGDAGGSRPPVEKDEGPSIVPGLVMAGVGVVGVGVGIGLLLGAAGPGADAEEIAASIEADGANCEPVTAGFERTCENFQKAADEEDLFTAAGAVSLIAGGLLLGGGVGWTIWASSEQGSSDASIARRRVASPHVTITPVLGASPGLRLGGAFF